ncbi:PLP-dependent aminotransferase family protein [Schnuerera sp. xch1]|uniref:aminotransferase-like domain-containing protein n=1 Tax=Schnuerera sp. xch1 TaxID=2874283 RepID=UPI001CBD9347|nr:PLP-dependent aminotransferase family protein [Schnuerera sp. xch1]MBZ2175399.1 PLP-dependent aminotransferase family protein [Schnuerera sp. xch1]
MSLNYAKRMSNMKASEIREMLKLTQRPEVISFAGGLPAPELFPIDQMKKVAQKVLDENGSSALQYGTTEGFGPLREKIVERMAKVEADVSVDNILVTSGSQQGLDFVAKAFINPGDVIICESPTYLGAINAFKAYEPKFVEVDTDDDGMIMEDLEKALKENKNAKFIYAIPDFQNPSGKTWSVERRKRLVELANNYNVAIVEDNPYGELRFEGEKLPSVFHYDTEGRVIFLGTFSKIFSPGLRLGWIAAAPEVLNKFIMIKQGADLQSSTISQMEVAKFLEEYDIEKHIEKIKKVYKKRKDLMIKTMEEEFPEEVKYTNPEGGLFTWVVLPEHINARDLGKKALEKDVAFVPGGSFFPNGGNENTFRMNYSNMEDERIVEGVKRLGEVIREALSKENA